MPSGQHVRPHAEVKQTLLLSHVECEEPQNLEGCLHPLLTLCSRQEAGKFSGVMGTCLSFSRTEFARPPHQIQRECGNRTTRIGLGGFEVGEVPS